MKRRTPNRRPVPLIAPSRCDGCGLCVSVCPTGALSIAYGKAVVSNPLACGYQGFCERVCPTQAIQRPFEILLAER
jgi:ferredoxin